MRISLDDFLALGRVTAVAPSPDGSWLAVAVSRVDAERTKLVSQLWRVSLDGGDPVQLTRGPSSARAPCFRRDGALGFLSDRSPRETKPEEGDDERSQVWVLPPTGGDATPLTDEPLGASAFRFAADGDLLVVLADVLPGVPHEKQRETARERSKKGPSARHYTSMPVRFWDHWIPDAAPHVVAYDARGGSRRDLTPAARDEHREAQLDVSRDGRRIAITHATMGEDRIWNVAIAVLDAASGETRLVGKGARTAHASPVLSADGARLATLRNVREDLKYGAQELVLFDLDARSSRVVLASWDRWPVPQCFVRAGTHLVVTADDERHVPVYVVDLARDSTARVTSPVSGGSHEMLAVVEGHVVGIRHTQTQPPTPFRVPLAEHAAPELVADVTGLGREARANVVVEHFDVRADDGETIQSLLVRPRDVERAPVLFWVHGGPVSQWADGWHWRWSPFVMAHHGYAVVLPNPRGSTGRGHAFVDGVIGEKWNQQVMRDLDAVLAALAERPGLDASRIAAMGGSYGGYVMNWLGGTTTRFRALVTHASVFRMDSFFTTTDLPAWATVEVGVSPWKDPAKYDAFSPHVHVAKWKTPTLVVHGEKDYRVSIDEGLALFEALQVHGVPSELLAFPDEGHWILKPRNAKVWYETVLAFLAKHL